MDKADLKIFGQHLDQLAAIFNVDLPVQKKHAYWVALEDMPLEAVQHACVEVLKNEGFMPVPAILRSHAREWRKLARPVKTTTEAETLQIREDLMNQAEVQALIASVWPDDRLKDPLPPHEETQP